MEKSIAVMLLVVQFLVPVIAQDNLLCPKQHIF
jgi:hypothetical protein